MMRTTLAIALAVVAVLGAVSVAAAGPLVPASTDADATSSANAPAGTGDDAVVDAMAASPPNESNTSMGAEVSAFMQANAADANASVDSGMFASAWNQSNATPATLVNARSNALENRLAALERQKERVLAKQDQLSDVAYKAQLTRLAARIDAIQRAINSTSTRAASAGVNTTRLDALRDHAHNLTGPEVAAIARNLSAGVGPPDHARNGPPGQTNDTPGGSDDAPGEGDSPGGSDAPAGNDTPGGGPPDDASTNESGTDSQTGSDSGGDDGATADANDSSTGSGSDDAPDANETTEYSTASATDDRVVDELDGTTRSPLVASGLPSWPLAAAATPGSWVTTRT